MPAQSLAAWLAQAVLAVRVAPEGPAGNPGLGVLPAVMAAPRGVLGWPAPALWAV
jgi:hypothetical protein